MKDLAAKLRQLNSNATPGPWFATDAPYWEGKWADGTLSSPDSWTVSTDPKAVGWNTDGRTGGYGISQADAELLALLRTNIQTIIEALEKS